MWLSFHSKITWITNSLSQVVLVSQLTQGSILEFFPSVTRNSSVMLNKDIKLNKGYINTHNTLWASKTGFQWTKWILDCDTCIRPFITEELWSSIFSTPENFIMINGNKGYAESRNRKTWIGSNGDSDCGIVPFQAILLTEEFKKNYGNHARFPAILSPHFEKNILGRTQVERLRENNYFCLYNPSNVHLVLLSQYGCHVLSVCIEEIRVFPIMYLWVLSLCFQ